MFSAFTIVCFWVIACSIGFCFPQYEVRSGGVNGEDVDDSFVTKAMYLGIGSDD